MAKTILRVLTAGLMLATVACAAAPTERRVAPREIRDRTVEVAAQYVESSVSPEEVSTAVQSLIMTAPVCMGWPTLWLQDSGRRTVFLVRYDLMMRDWGATIATSSRERMNGFVAAGFLEARPRDELGPGATEYRLTSAGDAIMDGSPYSGERPTFCAPAERRLVAVTAMEWGEYPCGNLRVRFTHVGDDWPSWARAEAMTARLAQTWPALGAEVEGAVTLSRRWRADSDRSGVGRGELASICYDQGRTRIIGDDLVLFTAAQ